MGLNLNLVFEILVILIIIIVVLNSWKNMLSQFLEIRFGKNALGKFESLFLENCAWLKSLKNTLAILEMIMMIRILKSILVYQNLKSILLY